MRQVRGAHKFPFCPCNAAQNCNPMLGMTSPGDRRRSLAAERRVLEERILAATAGNAIARWYRDVEERRGRLQRGQFQRRGPRRERGRDPRVRREVADYE